MVRPPLRVPFGAAGHFERVAQRLRAVRWPGRKLFQWSEMTVGPLHVPAALRASAQERSGLAPHFVAALWRAPRKRLCSNTGALDGLAAHFAAPLWRAPLVQSAKGRGLIETRGIFTLRVRLRFGSPFT